MKERVLLVTGGAGFIGSAVVRHLIANTDWRVVNVDKLTYAADPRSLTSVEGNPRYEFHQVDICDQTSILELLRDKKPSAIMHLAAETHVDNSVDVPAPFIQTNVFGTYSLLEATRAYLAGMPKQSRRNFRFHHVSTDEVYGDLDEHPYEVFREDSRYLPSSPYSASKAAADHFVRAWRRTYGIPIVMTSSSNNYGPYQHHEKFIPVIITKALSGVEIPIYGDGLQERDWIFVDDHVLGLLDVLERGVEGETYNIGGGETTKNINIAQAICEILDILAPTARPKGGYAKLIRYVSDRLGHDRCYRICADKISKELGWNPKETLQTGLQKTVEWYLNSLPIDDETASNGFNLIDRNY